MSEDMLRLPDINLDEDVQAEEILLATQRLTEILRQESGYLRQMQIKKAGGLQEEKNRLISWLEGQKKLIGLSPEIKRAYHEHMPEGMEEVVEAFAQAVEENYHQSSVARAVNARIVQAVNEAVQAKAQVNTYTAGGVSAYAAGRQGVPFNVNQKA